MEVQQQKVQQRIGQQRVKHIVDSFLLSERETDSGKADTFDTHLNDLLMQYPHGLIELALVETLIKNWLRVPMQKGMPFLAAAHSRIKQWQLAPTPLDSLHHQLTPSRFSQITGLDPESAFTALAQLNIQANLQASVQANVQLNSPDPQPTSE